MCINGKSVSELVFLDLETFTGTKTVIKKELVYCEVNVGV